MALSLNDHNFMMFNNTSGPTDFKFYLYIYGNFVQQVHAILYHLTIDFCIDRITIDFVVYHLTIDFCIDRITIDFCIDRVTIDFCIDRITIDFCIDRITIDFCIVPYNY